MALNDCRYGCLPDDAGGGAVVAVGELADGQDLYVDGLGTLGQPGRASERTVCDLAHPADALGVDLVGDAARHGLVGGGEANGLRDAGTGVLSRCSRVTRHSKTRHLPYG